MQIKLRLLDINYTPKPQLTVAFMISKSHDRLTTLYDIAARIGDTVEQVMKTYGHLFPREKKDYLDNFNSLKI